MLSLTCTSCAGESPWGTLGSCPICDNVLAPAYPEERLHSLAGTVPGPGLERYRALLPTSHPIPYLGEGNTPLVASRRVGRALGLEHLWFKLEGTNPSGAFKDRPAALAAALALEGGHRGIVAASSGNAASALSAYGAAVGLDRLILMEPGSPPTKLRQTLATGARVLKVKGLFSRGPEALATLLPRLAQELGYYLGFMWAPVNPYLVEASKTLAYEVVAQLGRAPDVVLSPVGGGDLLTGQWRGYQELRSTGVVADAPRMLGVQASEAAPLYKAFHRGADAVPTLATASSRISGINTTFSGDHALRAIGASDGWVSAVDDESVLAMQRRLACDEGLWVEPVGAAGVAALPDLLAEGRLRPSDRVVCVLSGAGFKDADLAEEEAQTVAEEDALPYQPDLILARARKLAESAGR